MKAVLIALALLAPIPAAADTVFVDFNPDVLEVQYPDFYNQVTYDYEHFRFMSVAIDYYHFYQSFPNGTLLIEIDTTPPGPSYWHAYYVENGALSAVPEPATWALLLFGFAFFAIKGIWPGSRV